jgi:hypothetical protein
MDEERFQQMEKRLNEQAEATQAMNKTLNKFLVVMVNQEAARNIAPPPLVPTPLVITPLQALQPSRVKPGASSHFDGDRVQGCAFLTSCELYISLTQSDFVDDVVVTDPLDQQDKLVRRLLLVVEFKFCRGGGCSFDQLTER